MFELKQSATDKVIPFLLVSSTNHINGITGLTRRTRHRGHKGFFLIGL